MRLIDADETRRQIIAFATGLNQTWLSVDTVMMLLAQVPAADVAPVRHGRWISFLDGDYIMPERYYRCSRCGRVESSRQPYCHCGAIMDGERKENDHAEDHA